MSARIVDGNASAESPRTKISVRVASLFARTGRAPGLAVVFIGDDPASHVYVRSRAKQTIEVGMRSTDTADRQDRLSFHGVKLFTPSLGEVAQIHVAITRQEIESRVLEGLKEKLLAPDLVAEFMQAMRDEISSLRRQRTLNEAERARKFGEVERKISRLIRAIEDGLDGPSMKEPAQGRRLFRLQPAV